MSIVCEMCKDPEKDYYARGYCKNCYRKAMTAGIIETKFQTRPKGDYSNNICIECGVTGQQQTKGKCKLCYSREREKVRRNNPEAYQRKLDRLAEWKIANPEKVKENKRKSYMRHQPEVRERVKVYREANGEKIRERTRKNYHENKEHFKFKRIEALYGLSRENYDKMFSDQNGSCAICKQPKSLVVDHDHTSGKVRQLLCSDCNTTLGFLERQGSEVFMNHLKYMETHKEIKQDEHQTIDCV